MSADPDPTGDRILEAALQTMISFGIRRATVEEIARRAGVSHMTVYRRWPNKNELLVAVWLREAQTVFAAVDREVAALTSPEDKLVAGFTGIYWYVHTHPLMRQTVEMDPESVLPVLTSGAGPGLDMATTYLAGHVSRSAGDIVDDPYGVAEIFVRLTHSLLLAPSARHALETKEDAEQYARRYILPIARALVPTPSQEAASLR
ncbi:TetR/AcrR family transcriptional regulator [Mycobacterium sp. CBMA271]|uniref:TetR/AcrR family transcriptional regulator n=1 Tax=unclassified Mycobacteroides TaxID=2618759 RepID=UPI001328B574|nr:MULTISPECIES: TetR/AcrR family transcriptional regulator [unclassified Mycobacteroides]MUM15516.1 TetR family transcriptional regulator [Mycobacteroides sp. CBMA 326]MUM21782.1 TetR/AcrR family transcriptional regulator [Mycobacteroides sp. CBMA 271]